MATETITKLDAATRQLDLAILLHFRDADPFGVHALAGAAHRILADLIRRAGQEPKIPHKPEDIQRTSQPELVRRINEARNFLKHADRDHDQVLTFDPDWTGYLIYDAILMHMDRAKTLTVSNLTFLMWLSARYPSVPLLYQVAGLKNGLDQLRRLFPALTELNAHKSIFLNSLEAQTLASMSSIAAGAAGAVGKSA